MAAYNLPFDPNAMDTMPHPFSPLVELQLNSGIPFEGSMVHLQNPLCQQGIPPIASIKASNLPYDCPNNQVYPSSNVESMAYESTHDFQNLKQYSVPQPSHSSAESRYAQPYDDAAYNPQFYESQNISAALSSSPKPSVLVKKSFSNLPYDSPSFTTSFNTSESSDAQLFQSTKPSCDGLSFNPNFNVSISDAQFLQSNLPYDGIKASGLLDCNVFLPLEGFEVPLYQDGTVNTLLLPGIEAEHRQGVRGAAAAGCGRIGHGEDTVRRHGATNTVPIHPSSPAPQYAAAMATSSADAGQQTALDAMAQQQLFATLNEYLALEVKFQPRLCLPTDAEQGEVSTGARDGAAHIMRCLKVWFDLPADVLFHAINLLDRFLTKMKVRPCHVPCITVSCMNIALDRRCAGVEQSRAVTVDELVTISQSACTPRDVVRMSKVIEDKLSIAGSDQPVTALQWLRLFYRIVTAHTHLHCKEEELVNLIEIASCDYNCANTRTSELALVLLYHKLEGQLVSMSLAATGGSAGALPDEAYRVYELFAHLQHICHMSDSSLVATRALVSRVLGGYERGSGRARQRLVWRLSERTLKIWQREQSQRGDVRLAPFSRAACLLRIVNGRTDSFRRAGQDFEVIFLCR